MIIIKETVVIDGFEFEFSAGTDGLSSRGISFDPDSCNVSDTAFAEAFNKALWLWNDYKVLANAYFSYETGRAYRDVENNPEAAHQLIADVRRVLAIPTDHYFGVAATLLESATKLQAQIASWDNYRRNMERRKQPRAARPGYVYLLQSPTGAYKIGCTSDPDNRAKTFGVKLPFEVDFIALLQTSDMPSLESRLHRQFKEKRVNGEWFALDPADVEYIKGLAK
jgi:hypothetical protein